MVRILPHHIKNIIKRLIKLAYYSYPGYLFTDFINKLTAYKKEKQRVSRKIGYYPNLKNPQSFNEKILWKKIHDRNPLLPIISDKYKVRGYIKNILGEKNAVKILIPLLYVTDNPETIPFDMFSDEYVIKPNHASRMIILAENIEKQKKYTLLERKKTTEFFDCKTSREDIIRICKKWLSFPYGFHNHEWAYQKIKRKIIVEKLLRDSKGRIPDDYKFNMFDGKCGVIDFCTNRFIDLSYSSYDQNWKLLPVTWDRQGPIIKKPVLLKEMLLIAEKLSKGFDYIRVDLYALDNQIYFGELTNYPMSGATKFKPVSYDFKMGLLWKIKHN